jgi:hypothetical protein
MDLVQLLLPLFDQDGKAQPRSCFREVERELIQRFGGLTAYLRSPAKGRWLTVDGEVEPDDIVIFEVMTESIDHAWWKSYRERLSRRFGQDDLVVRAMQIERL